MATMITTQDINNILKESRMQILQNIEYQLTMTREIKSGIEKLEDVRNPGTSPFLCGIMFKATQQKYNVPNVESSVGFDANDDTLNNLVAFKNKLTQITPPRVVFIPIGSASHMVMIGINVFPDPSDPRKIKNEILYCNSLGGSEFYPGTDKFVKAVQDKFGGPGIVHKVPKEALQLLDRGDAYCGHWGKWFFEQYLKYIKQKPRGTFGEFAALVNSKTGDFKLPTNLSKINSIRKLNIEETKQYLEGLQRKYQDDIKNSGEQILNIQADKERIKIEDGTLISIYIKGILKGREGNLETIEVTFNENTTPVQKRQAFEALK